MRYFRLDLEGRAVELNNMAEWAEWFEKAHEAPDARVDRKTNLREKVQVSTIFRGVSSSPAADDLWETQIFGGSLNGYSKRSETEEEAREAHVAAVLLVRQGKRGKVGRG